MEQQVDDFKNMLSDQKLNVIHDELGDLRQKVDSGGTDLRTPKCIRTMIYNVSQLAHASDRTKNMSVENAGKDLFTRFLMKGLTSLLIVNYYDS